MKYGLAFVVVVAIAVLFLYWNWSYSQGTYIVGRSESIETVSIVYSATPVSNPIYALPYFEATETYYRVVTITYANGTQAISKEGPFTETYPITPAMVGLNRSAYPSYIVSYYENTSPYNQYLSGQASLSLLLDMLEGKITPNMKVGPRA